MTALQYETNWFTTWPGTKNKNQQLIYSTLRISKLYPFQLSLLLNARMSILSPLYVLFLCKLGFGVLLTDDWGSRYLNSQGKACIKIFSLQRRPWHQPEQDKSTKKFHFPYVTQVNWKSCEGGLTLCCWSADVGVKFWLTSAVLGYPFSLLNF